MQRYAFKMSNMKNREKKKVHLDYYIAIDMSQDYVPLYLRAPFVGVHKGSLYNVEVTKRKRVKDGCGR